MQKITIRMDKELAIKLDEKIGVSGVSKNQYITNLIVDSLSDEKQSYEEIIKQNKQLNFNLNILLEVVKSNIGETKFEEMKTAVYKKINSKDQ